MYCTKVKDWFSFKTFHVTSYVKMDESPRYPKLRFFDFTSVAVGSDVYFWSARFRKSSWLVFPRLWVLKGKYGKLESIDWPTEEIWRGQYCFVMDEKLFCAGTCEEFHYYYFFYLQIFWGV